MYESLRSVYFPTTGNVIVTESNSLSWLMMKRISDQLLKERCVLTRTSFHQEPTLALHLV